MTSTPADKRKTALITGAASGIGAAFARHLAAGGFDLILVDRAQERLALFVADLQKQHKVTVQEIVADLSNLTDIDRVSKYISTLPALELLINNAGFGTCGKFAEVPIEKSQAMITVHITAATRFVHAALPAMIACRSGAIINMASIGAFLRFPESTVYFATKSYLVTFTETLRTELLNSGIKVMALCPGWIRTDFSNTPDMKAFDPGRIPGALWMTSDQLVTRSLWALDRGKVTYIPSIKYKLFILAFGSKFGIALTALYRRLRKMIWGSAFAQESGTKT